MNPLRIDPSRTGGIRKRILAELAGKFADLEAALRKLLLDEDAFGLKPRADPLGAVRNEAVALVVNTRWRFLSNPEKIAQFQLWLAQQIRDGLMTSDATGPEDLWTAKYVKAVYRQGVERSFADANRIKDGNKRLGFYEGTRAEFLRSAFDRPVAIEKLKLLALRVYTELKGITDGMAQVIARELIQGMAAGDNPRTIADAISARLGVTQSRADTIARTEIMRAHAEGQLDAMEQMGVEAVGAAIEWSTAGDDRVCPKCQPLEGVVLKIKEARGMLPRHPNCRCAWVPAGLGEDDSGQKKTRKKIEEAIDESIKGGKKLTKSELARARAKTTWSGADRKIEKSRPKSLLDDIE